MIVPLRPIRIRGDLVLPGIASSLPSGFHEQQIRLPKLQHPVSIEWGQISHLAFEGETGAGQLIGNQSDLQMAEWPRRVYPAGSQKKRRMTQVYVSYFGCTNREVYRLKAFRLKVSMQDNVSPSA